VGFYIDKVPEWVHAAAGVAVVVTALWRGGREERVGALVIAFQFSNENVAALRWTIGLPTDVASLAVFLWLVLRGARYWTVWAAASVVLSLATHALHAVLDMGLWAYLSAQVAWSYVLMGALLVGSLQRRRSATGKGAHVH
jgi:hypothetical protein